MTTESNDGTNTDPAMKHPNTSLRVRDILKTTGMRIRQDPVLCAPFAIVGLLVSVADWLRKQDPLPVTTPNWFEQTLTVQYSIFPMETARTVRRIDALFDLRLPYFLGAVTLELLVLLSVGVAGWMTITRALDGERRLDSLIRYLGILSMMVVFARLLGSPTLNIGSLPLGALVLFVVALVLIRLFLFPGLLAAGYQFTTVLKKSVRTSQGKQWTLFWLIVIIGLASGGLAHVPIAGGFLSAAVVAPIHAISLAILIQHDERYE
ncbi:hypothetical protein [Halocatena marina]|uniref:Uncharacterized protein n=1 Tax=Halocatena marina TaxID=2934937 RepID=A0ABD5YW73_9EURY|nr:hypothetical protein [Halocatena marina]